MCGALTVALLYSVNLRLFQRPLIAAAAALLFGLAREIWAQAVVAEVYTLHTALIAAILLLVVWRESDHAARGWKPSGYVEKPINPLEEGWKLTRSAFSTGFQQQGDDAFLYPAPRTFFAAPFEGAYHFYRSWRAFSLQRHRHDTISENTSKFIYPIALLFALALANHMAALLVAVILLPYLLWRTSWRLRIITLAIIAVTTALLYLYLPLRFTAQPAFNLVSQYFERDLTRPDDLLWMVSGRMFGREMLAYPLLDWLGEIGKFGGELWLNFLGVGVLAGLVGVYHLWQTRRSLCLLLAAIFAAQVLFFSSYNVFDKNTMFHTAYLVWAIFVAAGCIRLLDDLPRSVMYAFLGLLVIAQLVGNWNTVGRAGDTFVVDRTTALLAALPPDATLIGPWTAVRPLEYAQIVNDQRHDVQIVDVTLLTLGERDRLGASFDALTEAVDARLNQVIACAAAAVYVVDPAILDADLYPVQYVQSGLYRVTGFPPSDCANE